MAHEEKLVLSDLQVKKGKLVYPVLPDIQVDQERRVTKEHLACMVNPGTKAK